MKISPVFPFNKNSFDKFLTSIELTCEMVWLKLPIELKNAIIIKTKGNNIFFIII